MFYYYYFIFYYCCYFFNNSKILLADVKTCRVLLSYLIISIYNPITLYFVIIIKMAYILFLISF